MSPYAKDQPEGYNNYITNIVLVGAGGQVGGNIATALAATGKHNLTALTREGSTKKAPAGFNVVSVPSYDDEDAVADALRAAKAQVLVITLSVTAGPDTQTHLIRAAVAAGVPFVVPNSWGLKVSTRELAEELFFGMSDLEAVQTVRELGGGGAATKLLFFACGFWFDFSLAGGPDRFGFDFDNKSFMQLDDGETKMHVSTLAHTGRAVAAALGLPILPESAESDGLTLSGVTSWEEPVLCVASFLLSQKDMFDSVKRVTGTTDADWTISTKPAAQQYQEGKDAFLGGDHKAFAKLLYGRAWYPGVALFEKTYDEALGLPKEDLDEETKKAVHLAETHAVPY